ncbi:MAG: hypothetical protein COB69_07240 [Phycisphaera sp.]|nr:MAG: hypothetical protein COB69_07240 [Phycisphaera sp.]
MTRAHLLSAGIGSVTTLLVLALFGIGQNGSIQSQSEEGQPQATEFPWGDEQLNAQAISVIVEYEKEWREFLNLGATSSGRKEIKAVALGDHITLYYVEYEMLKSHAKWAVADEDGTPQTEAAYGRFIESLSIARSERSDLLYHLITGPFESRLPDEYVAERFPPKKP